MLLRVEDVWFKYPGNIEVLKGASFHADNGEVVAIIGANGSGKTTLLMISSGLLEPDKGKVLLDGEPLYKMLPEARRRIGVLFQNPDDQLFNPTVYDELAFSLNQLLPSKDEVNRRVMEVSGRFGLDRLLHRTPYKLSVGEKRIVTLASILAYNPELLLLDEPTANLSLKLTEEMKRFILHFRDEGKSVVIASHDVDFIAKTADRVYVLYDGVAFGGLSAKVILSDNSLLEMAFN